MRCCALRKILEVVMANNCAGVFCANSHARHARVAVSIGEVNLLIDKDVMIIRAARRENERAQDYDFDGDRKSSHKFDNRKSKIENRK